MIFYYLIISNNTAQNFVVKRTLIIISLVSLMLQLSSNILIQHFVPVNLGTSNWKSSTESFESGLAHGLIILSNSSL